MAKIIIISLLILGGIIFTGWWVFLRSDYLEEQIVYEPDLSSEPTSSASYGTYEDQATGLVFQYPADWYLNIRKFGNTQNIQEADLALTASSFDISYFKDNDARPLLSLSKATFCQQTANLDSWQAKQGDNRPVNISDTRCSSPVSIKIDTQKVYTFANQTSSTSSYSIFVPFAPRGGMVFFDSVPIPPGSSSETRKTLTTTLQETLQDKVKQFNLENEALLRN